MTAGVGEQLKVRWPGERIWVQVTKVRDDGKLEAELRNDSIHGIGWGTAVLVEGEEIVGPAELLAQAESSCEQLREQLREMEDSEVH